jgi:hypothetical protein
MSPKEGGVSIKACLALVFYLIIPCVSLLLILQMYPELPRERFIPRIYWILPTATIIVVLAQLTAMCQRGDTKRFLLNISYVVMTLIWIYGVLGGGIVMTSEWNGYAFALHMNKYVMLIICAAVLNLTYYVLEWKVFQKERQLRQMSKKKTSVTPTQ